MAIVLIPRKKIKLREFSMAITDQTFAAALPIGIVMLDPQMEIVWWNLKASELLNLDESKRFTLINNHLSHEKFLRYLENPTDVQIEIPAPHEPKVHLSINIIPYVDHHFLLIANDITHTHQLETIRRDFVANVSHELRTPLTVLKGYMEALIGDVGIAQAMRVEMLEQMQTQVIRIENLVSDLLLLTRLDTTLLEPSQMERVDIRKLLQQIVQDAKSLSGSRNHHITLDIQNPEANLYGNESELRSAFSNLIFNAVQYTPPSGSINIVWCRDKSGAHLKITDSGIGIESKHLARITERFYRVDKSRSRNAGGTGLGLAIVKHVLIRHHAELKIESTLGKGSCFQCDFPEQNICVH